MKLTSLWQIIFYDASGRQIYFPACKDAELLRAKLAEARNRGISSARLVAV